MRQIWGGGARGHTQKSERAKERERVGEGTVALPKGGEREKGKGCMNGASYAMDIIINCNTLPGLFIYYF